MESDIKEIFRGFKNLIFKDQEVESIAEERLKRCFVCPLRTDNFCDKTKEENGTKGCGCYLEAKTRSNSECPLKKW